ncbi:S-layer homology domain-containing protein [Agathobaculum sp. NTUH-O15-33]|uniref:S-layer homology domain-containing protein n=1 Tax=Agathobaculum sp. NTUH-O15-33 TaxID=3079302 RepID=UPI0029584061|nr:S-layer homology domain-containing protein [Agathobaculum sp. NTUH-O15-33]WNX83301.1 S-layer homology domain-containing protein [Agathobaculum sp. NTUH-O15-33]
MKPVGKKLVSLLLSACLLTGTAPALAVNDTLQSAPDTDVTDQYQTANDTTDHSELVTYNAEIDDPRELIVKNDMGATITYKNAPKKDSTAWEKAGFTHNGNTVWQSSNVKGYSTLAFQTDKPCYIVYDYTLASANSSSLSHKATTSLDKTSASLTKVPKAARVDYADESALSTAEWQTTVMELTAKNPVLWLEHSSSDIDTNPLKRSYISNIQIYETLDDLPDAYKATVNFTFNTAHGYVDSKYTQARDAHAEKLVQPTSMTVPLYSYFTLYFRTEFASVNGWSVTDAENAVLKTSDSYSLYWTVEQPGSYTATLDSKLFSPGPERMELLTWDSDVNSWSSVSGDDNVADYEGYWWDQAYETDKNRQWRIQVTKGAAAYENLSVTDNGQPVTLDADGCYDLIPGNDTHAIAFHFQQAGADDLVRTVMLWPTIRFDQAWSYPETVTIGPDDPMQLYWGNQYPFQFNAEKSTPDRTVFTTTNQDAYLGTSYMNVQTKQTGLLSFDYMVDGSDRNDLVIKDDDTGAEFVRVNGKKGWTHVEIPIEVSPSSPEDTGKYIYIEYINWDGDTVPNSYAALSNLQYEVGTKSITLNISEGGTVNGLNTGSNTVELGKTITLTATPNGNNQFLGWLDAENNLLSAEATYSFVAREDQSITALFADPGGSIAQAGLNLYDSLPEAFEALSQTGGTVRLLHDYTLPENITVPAGVTLLIPYAQTDTGYNASTGYNPDGTETKPNTGVSPNAKRFCTLTVPADKTLTINGSVLINAVTGRPAAGHYDMDVTGGFAQINLAGSIDVSSGGLLDVCGYIKGSGTVTALPGGEIRDLYVVRNWRGGSQAFEVFPEVYPMNQVDMHNIEAKTVIQAGGSLTGTVKMNASGSYYYTRFPQVDPKNGLIRQHTGSVVKTYDPNTDREKLVLSGGGSIESSTLEIVGMDLSTSSFLYPIDGDMDFILTSGAWTVNERLKFMPGASITVADGASLTVSDKTAKSGAANQMVLYDSFQPEDPKNTSTTAYPKDRGPSILTLQGGAALTLSGAFGGAVQVDGTATADKPVRIATAPNTTMTVTTLEANGYCNGTRELTFPATLNGLAMTADEAYKCYFENGTLVLKTKAEQGFEDACARLDAAAYADTSVAGEEALAAYVKGLAETAVNDRSIAVTVTQVSYTAPVGGTSEKPEGVNGSYTFTSSLAAGGKSYTAAQKTIAVLAEPYHRPSSGGSGGGGGGNTNTSKGDTTTGADGSVTTTVTDPTTGTVTETTKSTDGSTTVTETQKDGTITETVKEKDGSTSETVTKPDGSVTAKTETASGIKSEASVTADGTAEAEATVPAKAIPQDQPLSIETPAGSITLPPETLSTVASAKELLLSVSVTPAANDSAGNVATIRLSVKADGKAVTGLGSITLRVPVGKLLIPDTRTPLADGKTAASVQVTQPSLIVRADGTLLPGAYVTGDTLVVTLTGDATLTLSENAKDFSDVPADHWAHTAVAFATARELFSGTGERTFSPGSDMTRAMLMTVLARLDGQDVSGGATYYEKAMVWAQSAGISDGKNALSPITREQLAAMLYRYAGSPAVNDAALSFADAAQASSYAGSALRWAVDEGLLTGKPGGLLDPKASATRAEVSAILMRYLVQ